MTTRTRFAAAFAACIFALPAFAADGGHAADFKPAYTFGTLKVPAADAVRDQTLSWLREVKGDETAFAAVWAADKPMLDRVADAVALGNADAAKLLAEARDPAAAAPKATPALFKNAALPAFARANLAVAYAKALAGKRVFEEALDALKTAVPEQVVDPAAYYFHKAGAEHGLSQKKDAVVSIARLLDDVAEVPERYKSVAWLMFLDMQQWQDGPKDLGQISRLMDNIERRLDLSRGGPKTQEIQKKVVFRLDELIKEIENQMKAGGGQCQCPGGGQQPQQGNSNQPTAPQEQSVGGTNSGPGVVDQKKLQHLAQGWGKMPEKERAKAMTELTKDLPPRYREVIENYFKTLAKQQ